MPEIRAHRHLDLPPDHPHLDDASGRGQAQSSVMHDLHHDRPGAR